MAKETPQQVIELKGKELVFKNFQAKKSFGSFKNPMFASFCLIVSEDEAKKLQEKGVRVRQVDDLHDGGMRFIEIRVPSSLQSSYFHLDDNPDIGRVDVKVHPVEWEVKDKSGTVLFLEELSQHQTKEADEESTDRSGEPVERS